MEVRTVAMMTKQEGRGGGLHWWSIQKVKKQQQRVPFSTRDSAREAQFRPSTAHATAVFVGIPMQYSTLISYTK